MILAFCMSLILFAIALFMKRKLLRKHWYLLFSLGLVLAFLVSFVSVWSAWDPYAWSLSLRAGNFSGASCLSYPLSMSVYIAPAIQRTVQGARVVGNVSIDVFIAHEGLVKTNGLLSYAAVFGSVPVTYQFESPFSDGFSFFSFLILLFTIFNLAGHALGLILAGVVSKLALTRTRRF